MASLSERLKRERELRGISLKQISEETKITVRFLAALEEDRVDSIPGEFYRRSYLRAYARYLGLDEERAVNAYLLSSREKSRQRSSSASAPEAPRPEEDAALPPWVKGVGALVVLVVAVSVLYLLGASPPSEAPSPPAWEGATAVPNGGASAASGLHVPGAAGPRTPFPEPNGAGRTAGGDASSFGAGATADASPFASADPDGSPDSIPSRPAPARLPSARGSEALQLVIRIEEECWLEIHADGRLVATGLKEQGYRQSVSAREEVRLWLGNAGGVSLWVNDRPARPLGRPGQVRKDLSITPDNYRSYLSGQESF